MHTCLCMRICMYGVTLTTPHIYCIVISCQSSIPHSYCSVHCNADRIIALKRSFKGNCTYSVMYVRRTPPFLICSNLFILQYIGNLVYEYNLQQTVMIFKTPFNSTYAWMYTHVESHASPSSRVLLTIDKIPLVERHCLSVVAA